MGDFRETERQRQRQARDRDRRVTWTAFAVLVMFYLLNSIIYNIKRFVDL